MTHASEVAQPDMLTGRRLITDAADSAADQTGTDPEHLRAMFRNLRAIAASNLDAALIAARHAERTAIANREQLEALAASINGYDDLLTQITAPTTLND